MCRAMGPTYAWVFPHRGKPDGPAHHPESPFYKREKPRSNGGTISRTTPRRQLCGSGARRTGSPSARPEVTVLLSTGGVDENAGYAGIRPTVAQSCTNPGIVSLAARAGPWQPWRHDDLIKPLPRLPLPARGHRARRLALSLLQSESTRCRADPGGAWDRRQLREHSGVGPALWPDLRQYAEAATATTR